jgi:hypothetical protein
MATHTIILRGLVVVMASIAVYFSLMRIVGVGFNFLSLLGEFRIGYVTPETDRSRNFLARWIFFMATFAGDASLPMSIFHMGLRDQTEKK